MLVSVNRRYSIKAVTSYELCTLKVLFKLMLTISHWSGLIPKGDRCSSSCRTSGQQVGEQGPVCTSSSASSRESIRLQLNEEGALISSQRGKQRKSLTIFLFVSKNQHNELFDSHKLHSNYPQRQTVSQDWFQVLHLICDTGTQRKMSSFHFS